MHGGGQRGRVVGRVAGAIHIDGGDDVRALQVRQTKGAGNCLVVFNNHVGRDVGRTCTSINSAGFGCSDCGEQVDIDGGDAGLRDTDGHQVDTEVNWHACGLVHIVFASIVISHLGNHNPGVTADVEAVAAISVEFARADEGDAITPVQINYQPIAIHHGAGNHGDVDNVAGDDSDCSG